MSTHHSHLVSQLDNLALRTFLARRVADDDVVFDLDTLYEEGLAGTIAELLDLVEDLKSKGIVHAETGASTVTITDDAIAALRLIDEPQVADGDEPCKPFTVTIGLTGRLVDSAEGRERLKREVIEFARSAQQVTGFTSIGGHIAVDGQLLDADARLVADIDGDIGR